MKYVDLGLPSGTLWSETIIRKCCAVDAFDFGQLPAMEQLYELYENCSMIFISNKVYIQSKINKNIIIIENTENHICILSSNESKNLYACYTGMHICKDYVARSRMCSFTIVSVLLVK